MPEDNALSCHHRPATLTPFDIIFGALLWGLVVAATFAWTQRDAIAAWFSALR